MQLLQNNAFGCLTARSGDMFTAMSVLFESDPPSLLAQAGINKLMCLAWDTLPPIEARLITAKLLLDLAAQWNIGEFWNGVQPSGYAVANTGDKMLIAFLERVFKFGTLLGLQLAEPGMTAPGSTPPPPPSVAEASYTPAPLQEQQKAPVTGLSSLHASSTPSLKGPGQAPKGSRPTARAISIPSTGGNRGIQKNPGESAGVTSQMSTLNVERLKVTQILLIRDPDTCQQQLKAVGSR
jgi:hypothetical protein